MNHPKREEWIPFLFGEADASTRRRLRQHLDECPECAGEIQGWRRSLGRLDAWRLPKSSSAPVLAWQPVPKWAWAAVIVLGLGFLAGRMTAPSRADLTNLQAKVESAVRSSLRADMADAVSQVQQQAAESMANAEARFAKASATERQQVLRNFVQILTTARADDTRTIQTMFRQMEDQHKNDLVAVRTDLETLASMTDDEFRQARLKLTQLAALTQNDQPMEN